MRITDYLELGKAIDETFGKMQETIARQIHKGVEVKHGNIAQLPYEDGVFDKVFCISALEHISNDGRQKALAEFRRVLKDDGMIILTIDYSKTSDYLQ